MSWIDDRAAREQSAKEVERMLAERDRRLESAGAIFWNTLRDVVQSDVAEGNQKLTRRLYFNDAGTAHFVVGQETCRAIKVEVFQGYNYIRVESHSVNRFSEHIKIEERMQLEFDPDGRVWVWTRYASEPLYLQDVSRYLIEKVLPLI